MLRTTVPTLVCLSCFSAVNAACHQATETNGRADAQTCTPNRADYDGHIRSVLQDRCGLCHGLQPAFGAPFTLLDYGSLIDDNDAGGRNVDSIVGELSAGTMPPPGNVQPTPTEFRALTQWASCGAAAPEYPSSQRASREILSSPGTPSPNLSAVPLLANQFEVPSVHDHYEDFAFDRLVDQEVFVRRIDVKIDNAAVVHHITLNAQNGSPGYLYAWAPGTSGIEFPDGGLRVRPSDSFVVGIHYSNRLGVKNIRDSSGIVMHVTAPLGTEYAMLDPNSFDITVPPLADASTVFNCTAESDFDIFAGMPHMHEIGRSFRHELHRKNGGNEMIIELENWSFSLQYFYKMGISVHAGDTMTITCNYRNESTTPVVGGQATTDEMCYSFLYVSPANAKLNCGGSGLSLDGLACRSAADCAPDQICCATGDEGATADEPPRTACKAKTSACPATPFGPIQLCATAAECAMPGTSCSPNLIEPSVMTCSD